MELVEHRVEPRALELLRVGLQRVRVDAELPEPLALLLDAEPRSGNSSAPGPKIGRFWTNRR